MSETEPSAFDIPNEVERLLLGVAADQVTILLDRRRAEDALRESEQRFRTFVDHATDAFFLHDDRLVVVDVNRQACLSLGYTRDELVGMTPLDFDSDVTPAMLEDFGRRLDTGEMLVFESRHRRDVLDTVLSIFECDRAWLLYPCDPEAASWQVPMERTRPEYPGLFALSIELPAEPDFVEVCRTVWASTGPVRFGPGTEHPMPTEVATRFNVQSQMIMAIYPKVDRPYVFGMHQCSYARAWTPREERLFQEIGRRLADGLTTMLVFRNLRDSEATLEEAQRVAHVGHWARDLDTNRITWSNEIYPSTSNSSRTS